MILILLFILLISVLTFIHFPFMGFTSSIYYYENFLIISQIEEDML